MLVKEGIDGGAQLVRYGWTLDISLDKRGEVNSNFKGPQNLAQLSKFSTTSQL